MASPPFNPAETVPGNDDIILNYPALERDFRDIMESWMLIEHNRYGQHAFQSLTSTERDAETHWSVGSVIYNETLARPQMAISIGPVVWQTLAREMDSGTRMLFQQTAAPTGWTKESDAAYEDAAVVGTTGSVGTGGSTAFSTVMASRTILQANLPSVNFTVTGTVSVAGAAFTMIKPNVGGNLGFGGGALYNPTSSVTVTPGTDITATLSAATAASGGSGTAMDFSAKRYKAIVAEKD